MKSRLNLLVGAFMAASGGAVVYGALTGRLAAMIAALVKPSDLGTAGGAGEGVTNATSPKTQSQNGLFVLQEQYISLGLNKNEQFVSEYDKQIEPLIAKSAQSGKVSDFDAATLALRNLIQKYIKAGATPDAPAGTPKQPIAKSGPAPKVPTPIVAPLVPAT